MTTTSSRPLDGIRVVDLSSVVMGPLATQILADQGADVIVVERPEGDANRHMGRGNHPDLSGPALNLMRNKRSIVLDVTSPEGHRVLTDLVATADVFVTNLRPGSRRRARLTYDDLVTHRHDLIYCAAAGFPEDDPRADDAAYDDIVQSATGYVDLHRRLGLPSMPSPMIIVDKVAGMAIANSITSALFLRERCGEGAEISLSMSEIATAWLLVEHGAAAIPEPPTGPPGYPRLMSVERRALRTSDGEVTILAYERHQFEGLVRLGGRDDLLADSRFETRLGRLEHIDLLYREYQTIAVSFTTDEFVRRCREYGVPAHPVVDLQTVVGALPVVEHPHAGAYRVTPPLVPGPTVDRAPSPAPLVGEHGTEILRSIGYTNAAIDELCTAGVVGRGAVGVGASG